MKLLIVSSGHSLTQGFIGMGSFVTGLCCEWEVLRFFLSSRWPMSELTAVPTPDRALGPETDPLTSPGPWASLINQLTVIPMGVLAPHRSIESTDSPTGLCWPNGLEGQAPREALSVPSSTSHRMPINLRGWKKVLAFKGLPPLPQAQRKLSVKRMGFSKASY